MCFLQQTRGESGGRGVYAGVATPLNAHSPHLQYQHYCTAWCGNALIYIAMSEYGSNTG